MMGNWLKLLRQQHINVTLQTADDFETRILECPGQWMTDSELSQLKSDLVIIAQKTLPGKKLDYGIFAEDENGLDKAIITIVKDKKTGEPLAFNALVILDLTLGEKKFQVLHLGLVMIDPAARSRGLSWVLYGLTCVFLYLRNHLHPIWISSVSQVPAVVGMVSETFSEVYPGPMNSKNRTLMHLLIARQILGEHRKAFGVGDNAKFDEDRFVITNAYTGGSDELKKSYKEATKHRNEIYNDFCKEELNYRRGDDILQIGKIDLNGTRRYFSESVPRNAVVNLSLAALWITLNRLALPMLHWLNDKNQWKTLRPYREDN